MHGTDRAEYGARVTLLSISIRELRRPPRRNRFAAYPCGIDVADDWHCAVHLRQIVVLWQILTPAWLQMRQ